MFLVWSDSHWLSYKYAHWSLCPLGLWHGQHSTSHTIKKKTWILALRTITVIHTFVTVCFVFRNMLGFRCCVVSQTHIQEAGDHHSSTLASLNMLVLIAFEVRRMLDVSLLNVCVRKHGDCFQMLDRFLYKLCVRWLYQITGPQNCTHFINMCSMLPTLC